jgi:hypothetical protein
MNLALYGIEADLQRDEVLSKKQVENTRKGYGTGDIDPSDGFGTKEIRGLHRDYSDTDKTHLIIVSEHNSGKVNGLTPEVGDWVALYDPTREQSARCGQETMTTLPRRFVAQQVAVHEFGHVIDAGELEKEDDLLNEVYSGDVDGAEGNPDRTPEQIRVTKAADCSAVQGSRTISDWSAMSSSFSIEDYHYTEPYNTRHIPYSIEELLSISS